MGRTKFNQTGTILLTFARLRIVDAAAAENPTPTTLGSP